MKYPAHWPRMVFPANQFGPSVMSTVRLGRKWLDAFENGGRDCVAISKTGKAMGSVRIKHVAYVRFDQVGSFLASNHMPESREYSALAQQMRRSYGSAFDIDSMVSVVHFTKED